MQDSETIVVNNSAQVYNPDPVTENDINMDISE
jgi:hypothetical protein